MYNLDTRLVAIINKELEIGVAMNALAHMSLGLGGFLGSSKLLLVNYIDADSNVYPNISKMPFIILRGKSNEIKKAIFTARDNNITYGAFTNTMTIGTYHEQLERTKITPLENLNFYGCIFFGPSEIVKEITKKFSLWK